MNNNKYIIWMFVFIFGVSLVDAQTGKTFRMSPVDQTDKTFRVLANRGQSKVKLASTKQVVPLKTGVWLSGQDVIISVKNSYIGLMHKTGKTLEIRKQGDFLVSSLLEGVKVKSDKLSSRYARFIFKKMNEKEDVDYRKRLKATGAVSRAISHKIQILAPKQVNVLRDKVIVSWNAPEKSKKFVINVKNIFDENLLTEETTETFYEIDFTGLSSKSKEELYIVSVKDAQNPSLASSDIGIKKMDKKTASTYLNSLNKLKSELFLSAEETKNPLSKIILASFYEEKGFILDALTYVDEAIIQRPDVSDFLEIKRDILERNAIKLFEERKKQNN